MSKFEEAYDAAVNSTITEAAAVDPAIQTVWRDLDLGPIEDHANRVLGIKVTLTKGDLSQRRGSVSFSIKSQDIARKCGAFGVLTKKVELDNFGGQIDTDSIWMPIHMSWEFKNGGSNGHTMFDANYDVAKDTWTFNDRA